MLAGKQLLWHDVSAIEGRVTAAAVPAPAQALERRWLVFAIVSIGLFIASIDQTIVATALPAIERDLHAGINWSGWTITIYALGQVIAMPMAGKISDLYGRKKVFGVSAAVFTIASLCCGFAPTMPLLLIIARSSTPGLVQAHVFVVFAILLVLLLPLIRLVPDHHGNW
jgi:MFS family permease